MTAVAKSPIISVEKQKIYDEHDVYLAIKNMGVLSLAYAVSKISNPYLKNILDSAHLAFSLSQSLHVMDMAIHSKSIEKKLMHPLLFIGTLWSPTCMRITTAGSMLTVAHNGCSKLYNYFKSSNKDQSQSALTGVLLHGFNMACQMARTKEILDHLEMAKPNEGIAPEIAAKELGVNPDPNCKQTVQTNPWEKGASIPEQVQDACKSTCKELQKNYYKTMVQLRDCKTPDCLATQQKINDMQAIARGGYGCTVPKNQN